MADKTRLDPKAAKEFITVSADLLLKLIEENLEYRQQARKRPAAPKRKKPATRKR